MAALASAMQSLDYSIKHTWDGDAVPHDPVQVTLKGPVNDGVELNIRAPFFDDSDMPPGKPGEPVWKLWDYEVVEAFFLGDDENYLEVEISPFGQHIVLLLKGKQNAVNFCLPLKVETNIIEEENSWTGKAYIPASYFPVNVTKFNAYAIHGKDETRTYLALYPVPKGKYEYPSFHRLEHFQPISFYDVLPGNPTSKLSELWAVKKDSEKGCE